MIGVEREHGRVEAAGRRGSVGHMTCQSDSTGDVLRNDFSTPKHVTMEMNVDSSPTTCVKVAALLDHVQGVCVCMSVCLCVHLKTLYILPI